jgi:hypothetical protein
VGDWGIVIQDDYFQDIKEAGFVVVIDDTIHFLNNFSSCVKSDLSVSLAMEKTWIQTGLAIFLTSIVLFFSFGALVMSDFGDVYVIGILISAAVIFAILSDLILAPILIKLFWN